MPITISWGAIHRVPAAIDFFFFSLLTLSFAMELLLAGCCVGAASISWRTGVIIESNFTFIFIRWNKTASGKKKRTAAHNGTKTAVTDEPRLVLNPLRLYAITIGRLNDRYTEYIWWRNTLNTWMLTITMRVALFFLAISFKHTKSNDVSYLISGMLMILCIWLRPLFVHRSNHYLSFQKHLLFFYIRLIFIRLRLVWLPSIVPLYRTHWNNTL